MSATDTTDPGTGFKLGVIPLGNTIFEGENNSYVLGLESDSTTTLIDTGVATEGARRDLRAGLDRYGLSFADIEQVLLTHYHSDHAGLAGEIQTESDCPVFVHEADAPIVAGAPEALSARDDKFRRVTEAWGMPAEKRGPLLSLLGSDEDLAGDPVEVTELGGGETFDLGSIELEAVHMPGHAAGLTGFAFKGDRGLELFSGDALLPYYTPNVGGADVRVEGALAAYLTTLTDIFEREYVRAWPGHRGPIINPTGRTADIIAHHRERTERVLSVLRSGPGTPWEVSAELFGSLEGIHVLHGPGEAAAHLEHLESAGIVTRSGKKFELEIEDPDLDPLFPSLSG